MAPIKPTLENGLDLAGLPLPYRIAAKLTPWAVVTGLTVSLVTFLIWQAKLDRAVIVEQSAQDRVMFRDELKLIHQDSAKRWEVARKLVEQIDDNQRGIVAVAELLREDREIKRVLTGAVRDLTAELRKHEVTLSPAKPEPRPKPKPEPNPDPRGGK